MVVIKKYRNEKRDRCRRTLIYFTAPFMDNLMRDVCVIQYEFLYSS